jgi:hypothetical protein
VIGDDRRLWSSIALAVTAPSIGAGQERCPKLAKPAPRSQHIALTGGCIFR